MVAGSPGSSLGHLLRASVQPVYRRGEGEGRCPDSGPREQRCEALTYWCQESPRVQRAGVGAPRLPRLGHRGEAGRTAAHTQAANSQPPYIPPRRGRSTLVFCFCFLFFVFTVSD